VNEIVLYTHVVHVGGPFGGLGGGQRDAGDRGERQRRHETVAVHRARRDDPRALVCDAFEQRSAGPQR